MSKVSSDVHKIINFSSLSSKSRKHSRTQIPVKFRGPEMELHSKADNAELMIFADRSFEGGKELVHVGFDFLVQTRQLRTQRF